MKTCYTCGSFKCIDEFYSFNNNREVSSRCKECTISYAKNWYKNNKEAKRNYDAKRREEKRQLYRDASKRFRVANPGSKNADTQLRRAELAKRKPLWVNGKELVAIYESAARVSKCLTIKHCVDHIIPLRGRLVSGLHVPANLRVIPESLNLRKSNYFEGVK